MYPELSPISGMHPFFMGQSDDERQVQVYEFGMMGGGEQMDLPM